MPNIAHKATRSDASAQARTFPAPRIFTQAQSTQASAHYTTTRPRQALVTTDGWHADEDKHRCQKRLFSLMMID